MRLIMKVFRYYAIACRVLHQTGTHIFLCCKPNVEIFKASYSQLVLSGGRKWHSFLPSAFKSPLRLEAVVSILRYHTTFEKVLWSCLPKRKRKATWRENKPIYSTLKAWTFHQTFDICSIPSLTYLTLKAKSGQYLKKNLHGAVLVLFTHGNRIYALQLPAGHPTRTFH